jgi:poly(hydroxyalkanoate) depolymerase family esterase
MLRRRFRTIVGAAVAVATAAAISVAVTQPATAQTSSAVRASAAAPVSAAVPTEETGFGSNPGGLQMYRYAPTGLPAGAPLVVAMHGCSQNANQYGDESGWVQLADRWRFALVLPQKTGNIGCFAWFDPASAARGRGEALSIKQMVDRMLSMYRGDANRVYVTGMSSGGAMTAVMLATYPDVFAGGAVVAGLPFGCATTSIQAFSCMNPGVNNSPKAWGDLVRAASSYRGPWPRVSLWHGSSDTTVAPANLTELMEQWTNVSGAGQTPAVSDTVAGYPHRVYADEDGRAVVETYQITGMRHGQPVVPAQQCGRANTYALDKGICAASYIAGFWGISAT